MKEVINDVLSYPGEEPQSFKVPMLIYESVDEADKAAGRPGATLDEANKNLLYRGTYADARELIVEIVQEMTKVPFLQRDTGEKDDKGQPIMERDTDKDSDAKYVKRALAAVAIPFDKLQAEITKRAKGYTYKGDDGADVTVPALAADITQRERKPKKPAVLPAKYKETAAGIIKAGNLAKFNKTTAKYGIAEFKPTGDAEKDNVALGWVCKKYADAKRAEADAETAAFASK